MTKVEDRFYTLSEAVDYLRTSGFDVTHDSLRRWESVEKLVKPTKRVNKTRMRVYNLTQLYKLEAIALLKLALVPTNAIKGILEMKPSRERENLIQGHIAECQKLGMVAGRAEEILGNI